MPPLGTPKRDRDCQLWRLQAGTHLEWRAELQVRAAAPAAAAAGLARLLHVLVHKDRTVRARVHLPQRRRTALQSLQCRLHSAFAYTSCHGCATMHNEE